MGNFVSYGGVDKKYIFIILLFTTFAFISEIIEKKVTDYAGGLLISPLMKNLGFILLFIPDYFLNKNISSKMDNNNLKQPTNKKNMKKIFLIIAISLSFLIYDGLIIFEERKYYHFELNSNLGIYLFVGLLILSFMSFIIFKNKFYKHQYVSIIIISALGLIRYLYSLINIIKSDTSQNIKENLDLIAFQAIIYSCLSIYIIFCKILIDNYFFSAYKICYIIGIINGGIILITYFIFSFIGISREDSNNIWSLQYNNKLYIDNIFFYFKMMPIYVIFLYFINNFIKAINFLLINILIQNYTICYIFQPFQIFEFSQYFISIIPHMSIIVKFLFILSLIIELFMTFIFQEIIEIKFCGLNKDIKKNILIRARLDPEINDPRLIDDSFEIDDDYVIHYRQTERKTDEKNINVELEKNNK